MKKAVLERLRIGPEKNLCYLVLDLQTGEAALFDPAFESEKVAAWVLKIAKKNEVDLKLKFLIATHGHWDHAGHFDEVKVHFPDAKIFCGEKDKSKAEKLGTKPDQLLRDGDVLELGKIKMKAIHTPGHTPGGICFVVNDEFLITGDTLFIDQCGRTDLEGGSNEELFKSLQRLKRLDGDLTVYPGHDYGPVPFTTLSEQIKTNPTLKANDLESFINLP